MTGFLLVVALQALLLLALIAFQCLVQKTGVVLSESWAWKTFVYLQLGVVVLFVLLTFFY